MAKHRYSSDKRQKEIKRQKRQEEKRLSREQKASPESAQDNQNLINEYLGIEPIIDQDDPELQELEESEGKIIS